MIRSGGLRILWVRHAPIAEGRTTRDAYLVPRIARRHEVHVVTWDDAETVGQAPWRRLLFRRTESLGLPTWVLPKLPRPPGWRVWWPSINQPMFQAAMLGLERHLRADVVVAGPTWTSTGFPPHTLGALRVFDFLDGGDWTDPHWRKPDTRYLDWSQAILAVSEALARVAEPWARPTAVIPNGLELEKLLERRARRVALRAKLGFENRRVVSLVGLTASRDLYWVETVRRLARTVDGFLFVAAGRGPVASTIEALARELPEHVRWMGAVPYEEALDLFVASDVTWYPGEDIGYFHNASPLKVFEGLGAGTEVVVAPRLRSLAAFDMSSLHFSGTNAEEFAAATARALSAPAHPSDGELSAKLAERSWDGIAAKTGDFLERLVAERRSAAQRPTIRS
jgi:glycosyltransferase involved in cell wall biosynthesis